MASASASAVSAPVYPSQRDEDVGTVGVTQSRRKKIVWGVAYAVSVLVLPTAVILSISWNACEAPLHHFVLVALILGLLHVFVLTVVYAKRNLSAAYDGSTYTGFYGWENLLVAFCLLFNIIWAIVGCVWLKRSPECPDKAPHLYRLSVALVVLLLIWGISFCGWFFLSPLCMGRQRQRLHGEEDGL